MEPENQKVSDVVENFDRVVNLILGLFSTLVLFNFIKFGLSFIVFGTTSTPLTLSTLLLVGIVLNYYLFWKTYKYFNETLNKGLLFLFLLFISFLPFTVNFFFPFFKLESFDAFNDKFNPFYILFGPLVMFVFSYVATLIKKRSIQNSLKILMIVLTTILMLSFCYSVKFLVYYYGADKFEKVAVIKENKIIENSAISNFKDSILLTNNNNPIGVRIQYNLRYNSSPVYIENPFSYLGKLDPLVGGGVGLSSVTPEPEIIYASTSGTYTYNFLSGVDYTITAVFLPPGLMQFEKQEGTSLDLNKTCFLGSSASSYEETVAKDMKNLYEHDDPSLTRTGPYTKDGKSIVLTSVDYNVKNLFDSILKENVKHCSAEDNQNASKLYYESSLNKRMKTQGL